MGRDLSALGRELRRIRAAERAEPGGGKRVWHQAAAGVEIISFVDARGEVTRQECHLDGGSTLWVRGAARPVSTATSIGRSDRYASEELKLDPQPNPVTLGAAIALLREVPPGDRYLDHLRRELETAVQHLEEADDHVVTTIGDSQQPPPRARPARSSAGVALLTAVAVVVLGLAGAWLFWR